MGYPKIEAAIVVPTGGYAFSVNLGGAATATIPAGTYYPTTLAAEVATQLEAARAAGTWTVAIGSTGLVTISEDDATFTITWTSTVLRDLLGYTGNLTGERTYTATNQIKAMWLSPCGLTSRHGSSRGLPVTVCGTSVAPTGATIRRRFATHYPASYTFPAVKGRYALSRWESVVNESFETAWVDYLSTGAQFRLYPDRDVATYKTFVCTDDALDAQPLVDGWEGASSVWSIALNAEEQP